MSKATTNIKPATEIEDEGGMATWQYLLIVGVIGVAGTGAYYGYRWLKSWKEKRNQSAAPTTTRKTTSRPRSTSSGWCKSTSYPLSYGNCHPDVKWLQGYLISKFGADLGNYGPQRNGVDGKFGSKTEQALKKHLGKTVITQQHIAVLKQGVTKLST